GQPIIGRHRLSRPALPLNDRNGPLHGWAFIVPGIDRRSGIGGGSRISNPGRTRAFFYGCTTYHKKGTSICGNSLQLPLERVDDAVLSAIGGDTLRPAVVMAVIDGVLEQLQPSVLARDVDQLRSELRQVERQLLWRPQRDSNPCFGLERATSWASGRWGPVGRTLRV